MESQKKVADASEQPFVNRLATISKLVMEHHEDQFGRLSWCRLATKLGEEVGELQGAIIRDTEKRDGRPWRNEMFSEIQDVLTVLHVMAARMGEELSRAADDAGQYFLTRKFTNVEKCD
jgi:NTP pyrophosphatase (non-canonical NTP hydrolase)